MNRNTAKNLVKKYNKGSASEAEKALLENWYAQQSEKLQLVDGEIDFDQLEKRLFDKTLIYAGLKQPVVIRQIYFTWPRLIAAASVLLMLAAGVYFSSRPKSDLPVIAKGQDIAPGGNKAVLTLANGQQILLTGARNGQLATQNQTRISKTANGLVAYEKTSETGSGAAAYNTMTTPRGGQYSLVLSDGTKVVLNAASSITYPVTFMGNERRVKLSGEAYFEVAHNKAMPFYVDSKKQKVEVLGTHFNVNAYDDEPEIKTTLLQGSVKITAYTLGNAVNEMLVPGQQATASLGHIHIASVDVEDAVAWKNGLFIFDNESLEYAMLKISRWYDLKIVYNDDYVKRLTVGGSLSRFEHVSSILRLFEKSGKVHFDIDGKTLYVSKRQ